MSTPTVRERIVDAAFELLRDGGFKRFGQTQVAKYAGVNQGHLTYYFPRKSDLALAVARRSIDLVAAAVNLVPGGLGKGPEARERVLTFVDALLRDRARTRILVGLLVEADETPEVREAMVEHANAVRGLLAKGLDLPPEGEDAMFALCVLWGLGLYDFLYRDGAPHDPAKLLARFRRWLDQVVPAD